MDEQKVLRYAMNLADFMKHVSTMLDESVRGGSETVIPPPQEYTGDPEPNGHRDEDTLEAIGLDDTSIMSVIIELSQDRTNFKVWVPYDEDFKEELKRSIPKKQRWFDREERCWRIAIDWFGNAQRLLAEHFPSLDRRYTDRALRMCEVLVREEEEERYAAHREAEERYHAAQQAGAQRARDAYNEAARRAHSAAHERSRRASQRSYDAWESAYDASSDSRTARANDPYRVLGVQADAPDEVIKAAYKAQARRYHSDLQSGDDDGMKRVNAAFEEIGRQRGWKP
jgi:hypothetical protein